MPTVNLKNNETQIQLLKRFKKKVIRSGILSETRKRRWFTSKSEVRRMDKKKAIRRLKKRSRQRPMR